MEKIIKHKCKENDNHFIMDVSDDEVSEILFGDCLGRSWLVIGLKDLKKGLKKAGYKLIKIKSNK